MKKEVMKMRWAVAIVLGVFCISAFAFAEPKRTGGVARFGKGIRVEGFNDAGEQISLQDIDKQLEQTKLLADELSYQFTTLQFKSGALTEQMTGLQTKIQEISTSTDRASRLVAEAEAKATEAKNNAKTAKMLSEAAVTKADANLVWVGLIGWMICSVFGFLLFALGWQLRPLRTFLTGQLRTFLTTALATGETTPPSPLANKRPAPEPIVETVASNKPLAKPLEKLNFEPEEKSKET